MIRNRLKHFQHILEIDKQKDFAEFLGSSQYSVNRWQKQISQPDTESLIKIYLRLRERIPGLHMEELFEGLFESME